MKKILMLLAFVVVSAMGETNEEIEKQLSQEERFEMLFGKTTLKFNEIRQSRTLRSTRNKRVYERSRVINEPKLLTLSSLREERYEMLFGKRLLTERVARTTRFLFPRQARQSLYVTLNF